MSDCISISEQARKDTYKMLAEFEKITVKYMEQEGSIIPHNEKFLVVSRAVNAYGVTWFNHFWRQFNIEEKLKVQEMG